MIRLHRHPRLDARTRRPTSLFSARLAALKKGFSENPTGPIRRPPTTHVRLVPGPTRSMSLTVAARHGAAALPVFSSCARANVRGLTSKYARHPARARHVRGVTVQTRAEMEYDYDIFTIGACPAERFSTSSASVSVRTREARSKLRRHARARRRDAPPPTIREDHRETRFSFSRIRTNPQCAAEKRFLFRSPNSPAAARTNRALLTAFGSHP